MRYLCTDARVRVTVGSPMSRVSEIEVFVQVVQAASLTDAAMRLDLSKSSVSRQLRALEDRLGARLIQRTTRTMSLTDAGSDFYRRCLTVLRDLEQAEVAVRSAQAEAAGTLRVTLPLSLGVRHIAPLLPAFLEAHPRLTVDVDFSDRFVDLVREGFDLAIRAGVLSDSSLVARRLASFCVVLVASPDYLDREGRPSQPSDLSTHHLLRYRQPELHDWVEIEGADGSTVTVPVSGRLVANNGDALVEAARAGTGVAVAPSWMVQDDLRDGRLEALSLRIVRPSGIWAVYPQRQWVPPKVRLLVEHLAEAWADPPWRAYSGQSVASRKASTRA